MGFGSSRDLGLALRNLCPQHFLAVTKRAKIVDPCLDARRSLPLRRMAVFDFSAGTSTSFCRHNPKCALESICLLTWFDLSWHRQARHFVDFASLDRQPKSRDHHHIPIRHNQKTFPQRVTSNGFSFNSRNDLALFCCLRQRFALCLACGNVRHDPCSVIAVAGGR